jgi:hypothetical protein
MRGTDAQGVAVLLQVQPRTDETIDVPAVPQREDEESEGSAMAEWWRGFCWGVGIGVAVDLAALGLFIIGAMIDDWRLERRLLDRIKVGRY